MESMLLLTTVLALVVAMAMSLVAWRVTRDEKRRTAARVTALSTAAFGPAADPQPVTEVTRFATVDEAPLGSAAARPVLGSATDRPSSGGRQRALAIVAALLFVGLSGSIAWMFGQSRAGAGVTALTAAPLELLSLTHERQASKLAVSGLVRNPVAAHPLSRLTAVVFLFDQSGTLVGSGRAAVDFTTLGAGDESPFVVALDAPSTVARYRVSFRTDDGLVPHVDRRAVPTLSAGGEQPVSVALK